MKEKDVIDLYCMLKNTDINIWIDGGWGVDALLLEEQGYREVKPDIAWPHNFVGNNYQ